MMADDVAVAQHDLRRCARDLAAVDAEPRARRMNTVDEMSDEKVAELVGKRLLVMERQAVVEYVCIDVVFSAEREIWMGECVPRSEHERSLRFA